MYAATVTLQVKERDDSATDRLGNAVEAYKDAVEVSGCLFAPTSTQDIGLQRPDGTMADATAFFPSGWADKLRRAQVSVDGERWFNVIGEPVDFPDGTLPDGWPWASRVLLESTKG
jgi:hypothetical protein